MNEDDVKRKFIEVEKKLFCNIIRQLENGLEKGCTRIADQETINKLKDQYKEIVYTEAREAYTRYKFKQAEMKVRSIIYTDDTDDDLFS